MTKSEGEVCNTLPATCIHMPKHPLIDGYIYRATIDFLFGVYIIALKKIFKL